jgi:hypothetical protein
MQRLILLTGLALSSLGVAAQGSLVIQRTTLAGFKYHQAQALWSALRAGDALTLVAEPANPHDPQAIRVDWQGQPLGYLPRYLNGAVSRAHAEGVTLAARIRHLREHPDPRQRIEIEILLPLAAAP